MYSQSETARIIAKLFTHQLQHCIYVHTPVLPVVRTLMRKKRDMTMQQAPQLLQKRLRSSNEGHRGLN